MARESRFSSNDPAQRLQALSRWDNEGGAIPVGPFVNPASGEEPIDIPELTNAELVALRIRVIALENLLISLLSTASDHQLEVAREMAGYISPRPGFTQHPLTIHAAARRCQSKFYTACLRAGTRWSSTVFAHELSQRAVSFEPENGLCSFALTMPSGC